MTANRNEALTFRGLQFKTINHSKESIQLISGLQYYIILFLPYLHVNLLN